jgi:Na+/H+ antiporter NhaD/arsenite permease-like protein
MSTAQVLATGILVATLVAQAALPGRRLLVVLTGAATSALASSLGGGATAVDLVRGVPWDVILILLALGLLAEVLASTRVFARLAVSAAVASRARPRTVLVVFAVGMYAVSGVVNNLTALLLVLPVLLNLLRLLGATQRFTTWTVGTMLVACNLGGAETPIGDFPAILLLGAGRMEFGEYLAHALPPTFVALLALLAVVVLLRPERGLARDETATRVGLAVLGKLHRNVRVDRPLLAGALALLVAMVVAWLVVPRSSGVGPELICGIGCGAALLMRPALGERLLRGAVDVEALLFFTSLFVMVGAVQQSGALTAASDALARWHAPPTARLVVFLLFVGLLTGVLSAGPSMAALLPVADRLVADHPPATVYVGLALAVCAGSSLFLTAATSGPLAQMLTERAEVRDAGGRTVRLGFLDFLPVGCLSFALIAVVAIATVVLAG